MLKEVSNPPKKEDSRSEREGGAASEQTETNQKREGKEISKKEAEKLFANLKEKAKEDSQQFLKRVEKHAERLKKSDVPEEDVRKLAGLTQELDKQEKYLLRAKHDLEDPDFAKKIDKKIDHIKDRIDEIRSAPEGELPKQNSEAERKETEERIEKNREPNEKEKIKKDPIYNHLREAGFEGDPGIEYKISTLDAMNKETGETIPGETKSFSNFEDLKQYIKNNPNRVSYLDDVDLIDFDIDYDDAVYEWTDSHDYSIEQFDQVSEEMQSELKEVIKKQEHQKNYTRSTKETIEDTEENREKNEEETKSIDDLVNFYSTPEEFKEKNVFENKHFDEYKNSERSDFVDSFATKVLDGLDERIKFSLDSSNKGSELSELVDFFQQRLDHVDFVNKDQKEEMKSIINEYKNKSSDNYEEYIEILSDLRSELESQLNKVGVHTLEPQIGENLNIKERVHHPTEKTSGYTSSKKDVIVEQTQSALVLEDEEGGVTPVRAAEVKIGNPKENSDKSQEEKGREQEKEDEKKADGENQEDEYDSEKEEEQTEESDKTEEDERSKKEREQKELTEKQKEKLLEDISETAAARINTSLAGELNIEHNGFQSLKNEKGVNYISKSDFDIDVHSKVERLPVEGFSLRKKLENLNTNELVFFEDSDKTIEGEDAVEFAYYAREAENSSSYQDYSGRTGNYLSVECVLPKSKAKKLIKVTKQDSEIVRDIAKRLTLDSIEDNLEKDKIKKMAEENESIEDVRQAMWEKGRGNAGETRIKPPYEEWKSERDNYEIYIDDSAVG